MRKKRVVVIGGGILGCAIFAFLSAHNKMDVELFEANNVVGGGTTAKNHGRIHCGATGVFSDPFKVTLQKMSGNRMLRTLPGILENKTPAVYRCESAVDSNKFRLAALDRTIDISDLDSRFAAQSWLKSHISGRAFSAPEFSLNPAKLAYALEKAGSAGQGNSSLRSRVTRVYRNEGKIQVLTDRGDNFSADFVVNAASKYANTIQFEDRPPLLDLTFHRWPVMAIKKQDLLFNSKKVPSLNQVITVIDEAGLYPSVIPHGDWITFDCKTSPEEVETPDSYHIPNPRKYNPHMKQEKIIFDTTRSVFRPLGALPAEDFSARAIVFYGVHGRRKGPAAESDISESFIYPDIENYIVRHGGLMTTALFDSAQTADEVELKLFGEKEKDKYRRLEQLIENMKERTPPMIWQ
jgi:hypothetical protein